MKPGLWCVSHQTPQPTPRHPKCQTIPLSLKFDDCCVFFFSSGPSELDLSLLGESSSLADVACKYDEVRLRFIITCWIWMVDCGGTYSAISKAQESFVLVQWTVPVLCISGANSFYLPVAYYNAKTWLLINISCYGFDAQTGRRNNISNFSEMK